MTNENTKYTVTKVTRIQEGATFEDIENGDAFEIAYLVRDSDGDIVWDTTNYENVRQYLEQTIYCLKGSYQYQYEDPIEVVEEYYIMESNAQLRMETLDFECCITHLEVTEVKCTEETILNYILEDEEVVDF